MDESGIDSHQTYQYGWSAKGNRFHSSQPGKRGHRVSIIGALCGKQFFAPMVYQGYCNSKVIEVWLENVLLPALQPGKVIIMDNASFHNSRRIREIIETAGCELLFLPTYSPDLNPIEHWWHKVKTAIRKELINWDFNIHQAIDAAFEYL